MTTRREIITKCGAGLASILAARRAPAALVRSMLAARNGIAVSGGGGPFDRAVAWLESDGSQHIKTGLYISEVRKLEIRAQLTAAPNPNASYICGGYRSRVRTQIAANTAYIFMSFGSSTAVQSQGIPTDMAVHDYAFDSGEFYIDGSLRQSFTWAVQNIASPFCLFARGSGTGGAVDGNITGRIFSCRLYGIDNSLPLLRDFIPVRVGSVGYMYDCANPTGGPLGNGLYPNSGSGAFTIGPDV